MATKKANTATKKANTAKEETIVSLLSNKEYKDRSGKSGDPLLAGNISSRLYANERENGTTTIVLAALAASTAFSPNKKEYTGAEYSEGIDRLRRDNYGNPDWDRLQKNYKRFAPKASDPAAKIGPVLSALRKRVTDGYIRGFDAANIGSKAERETFSFSF